MNTTNRTLNKHGFSDSDLDQLKLTFQNFPDIESVLLFGSRAKGTFKAASDVDLALIYEKDDYHIASAVKAQLEEETKIPYFFDVLDHKTISSEELKEHIRQHGVEIYRRV